MKVELPRVFSDLLTKKAWYKLYYGGRAGGKSYAFVDALLIKSTSKKKKLIACVREVQSSIKDSVHKLIADRIDYYGLKEYRIYEDRIVNINNNSKFIFKGIMDYNAQNIKSLEGVDICWCEEAQKISKRAWEILDPTIRKQGAEIWFSLNREEEEDPVWKAVGERCDEDVIVKKVNYYDNPYCPEDMKKLALKLKKENYSEYLHIWEGEPRNEASNNLIARKDVYKASADEAIDTAAEEVFVSRMVKLLYGKRTLGRDIASAANLYRTWLNKLTAGIGVTSKTSGEGGKEVLKFFRNKIK